MKSLFILILFAVMVVIMFSKGLRRFAWLMAGIFFLNETISIQPFNSYTLLLVAFFFSMFLHGELKAVWREFPFKWFLIILLFIHVLVVQFDDRSFPPLTYISRVFNNYVPRFFALFVGYAAVTSLKVWQKSVKSMALIFFIVCLYGFVTFLLQNNPYDDMLHMAFGNEIGIWSEVQTRGYRVFSTLSNPIVYGYVMFLAATYLYLQRKCINKLTYYALLLMIVLNAFLANSRTSVVAGALLCVVYAVVEYRFSLKKIIGYLLSVFLLFLILYNLVPFVHNTVDSVSDIFAEGGGETGGSNIELKETQFETSLLFFLAHPYFGNGFYYYQEVITQRYEVGGNGGIGLWGLEGYGYKLLVEEGIFMIIAVAMLFVCLIIFFIKRLSVRQYAAMGVAWIASFLFFILGTGTYGGIFTIGMLFIGMLLRYVQMEQPIAYWPWQKKTKELVNSRTNGQYR